MWLPTISVIWDSRAYFMFCSFLCYGSVLVFYVLGSSSYILLFLGELFWITKFIWMWCTIHGIFMLCVVSVVIMMVINANVGAHDKWLCFRNAFIITDAPPSSLMDSTVSPKVKTLEGEWVAACSLACNISRVKGCVGAPGWD